MKRKWKKVSNKGFTLLEMLVVLFIISLLLLLFIPNVKQHQTHAQNTGTDALEKVLQSQVDLYILENQEGDVPDDFTDLSGYLTDKQIDEANAAFTLSGGKVTRKNDDGQ